MSIYLIATIFFVIAALYASVGFGGGSSYIAILLLSGLANDEIKMIALLCNVIVVLGACINYHRAKMIPWTKVLPFVIFSVPFAFLGGSIQLQGSLYKLLAGITLTLAALIMLWSPKTNNILHPRKLSTLLRSSIGSSIGFISGLIGIGGGIFLSPLLNIIRWETAKVISVSASIFILFNSIAGIAGQLTNIIDIDTHKMIVLGLAVLTGGQLGNYFNIKILQPNSVRLLTAILVGIAGLRFILSNM